MRHEVAHYFDARLAPPGSAARDRYRQLFGDERVDYQAALDRHYADGPPSDWAERYVSAYASVHPWEATVDRLCQLPSRTASTLVPATTSGGRDATVATAAK